MYTDRRFYLAAFENDSEIITNYGPSIIFDSQRRSLLFF